MGEIDEEETEPTNGTSDDIPVDEEVEDGQTLNTTEDSFIYALPPKSSISEPTEEVGVVSTPALQYLDELFNSGRLPGARVAFLKSKYQLLSDQLRATREVESQYLHKAKELTQLSQKQKGTIDFGESFPSGDDNDVNRLRIDLLKHGNELQATNERIYQLDYKLETLKEEKEILQKELKRLPKKEEIDKKLKDSKEETEALKIEIAQRSLEIKDLNEEIGSQNEQTGKLSKSLEALDKEEQDLKDELVKIHGQPAHISKQSELIMRQLRELTEKLKLFEGGNTELNDELEKISERKGVMLDEKDIIMKAIEAQKIIYKEKDKEVDLLMKECDLAKERQAELLGDRSTFDINIKHAITEKKTEHDIHSRKLREKDRELKHLKKAELQLKVAKDALEHTITIHDKMKLQVDMEPKDDGTLLEKRKELAREVEIAKRAYSQQNSLTQNEKHVVEMGFHTEERLLSEQGQLRIDVVDLTRLAQIKAVEREQKARDFLKAELRYSRALKDLKAKDLYIQDSMKKFTEVQKRLEDFAKLYCTIKNERNKCVNMIQISTQRAAEMYEKVKILQNEIEILRTAGAAKDRQLQKSKLKRANAVVVRDSLRNEISKEKVAAEGVKEVMEQQRLSIANLNDQINKAEENMVELRRRYETAVKERNRRGVQLIERNEEVCVLCEKLNVQGSVLRNGDMELQGREEEIRFLNMEIKDLKRSVDLLRSSVPNKKALDDELINLQINLIQCQETLGVLEHKLEDPTNAERVRLLTGNDPSFDDLEQKIDELEKRLAFKEENLLEKDLIYEQENRLIGRIKHKSEHGKENTLGLAKKVNDVQCKIKETTRKMMAMISELSMNQAKCLKFQQEKEKMESHLEQCYVRMEQGQPPSDEIEQEWMKFLRDELRRLKDQHAIRVMEEEEEHYKIGGGIITTAEPRPNAYIPNDDSDLPLPRPYGGNAPFKPTELGSNMRHIKKPTIKPIEI